VFFKSCKDYVGGSSGVDANVDFLQSCNLSSVSALPLFARIKNKVLNLISYRVNEGHARALATYIKQHEADPSVRVETLILHDNGCSDQTIASILDSLAG
jgi:hypothetical protein